MAKVNQLDVQAINYHLITNHLKGQIIRDLQLVEFGKKNNKIQYVIVQSYYPNVQEVTYSSLFIIHRNLYNKQICSLIKPK